MHRKILYYFFGFHHQDVLHRRFHEKLHAFAQHESFYDIHFSMGLLYYFFTGNINDPRPVRIAHPAVALNLFYIAQEAVNNAVKHASSRKIYVSLTRRSRRVVLTVANGGKPFSDASHTRGLGLKTMRFRADQIGGVLEIQPRRNGGTLLTCTVPAGNTQSSILR